MITFWQGFEKRALSNAAKAALIGTAAGSVVPIAGPVAAGAYSSTDAPDGKRLSTGLRTGGASLLGAFGGAAAGLYGHKKLTGHESGLAGHFGAALGSGAGAYLGHRHAMKKLQRDT
jgi:hypothetical protein